MGRLIEGGIYSSAPGAEIPDASNSDQKPNSALGPAEDTPEQQQKRYQLQSDFINKVFGFYHIEKRDIDTRRAIIELLGPDVRLYTLYETRLEEKYKTHPEFKDKTLSTEPPAYSNTPVKEVKPKDPFREAVIRSQFRRLHITDPVEQKKFEHVLGADLNSLIWKGKDIQRKIDTDPLFEPHRQKLLERARAKDSSVEDTEYLKESNKVYFRRVNKVLELTNIVFNRHGNLPENVNSQRHN